MSLQNLAQNVQQAGRGSDSVLVHMTPQEVGGLQALALANGGSLTINPETGLPEAGFLSKILPMVAGALLAPMTAGTSLAFLASNPMTTALTIGGLTGLATGSLNKGFMAGLGAFGGAGLGQGLMTTGAANAATAGTTTAANAIQQAPVFAPGSTGALEAAKGSIIGANPAGVMTTTGPSSAYTGGISTVQTPVATQLASRFPANQFASSTATQMPSGFDALKGGFKAIAADPAAGMKSVWENMPTGTGLASIASLANAARPDYKPPKQSKSFIRPYRLERNYESAGHGDTGYGTSERRYFDDQFTALEPYEAPGPEYAARGGLLALADGGAVDEMTLRNALSGNENFPMARQKTPAYAVPAERAIPEQVLTPAVDRYTGEVQGFANGGQADNQPYQYGYGYIGGGMGQRPQYGPGSGAPDDEYDPQRIRDPYKYDYDRATGLFTQKAGPGTPAPTGTKDLYQSAEQKQQPMLNSMFQKYLGRDIDPEALTYYTQSGFTPEQLSKDIMGSREYKENLTRPLNRNVINAAYQDILRRDVDEPGFQNYAVAGMTPDQLRNELMKSEEYQARQQQLVNRDQADQLYQQLLGRSIDPMGLNSYVGAKNMTADELKNVLMQSDEYKKREGSFATATQAANLYRDVLGRTIDPEALKFYTQQQRMTPAELKKTLMQSDEYLTKLTKPLVPLPQVNKETGRVSIEGAMRTPEQEAARPQDMSNFYNMMNQRLAAQGGFAAGGGVYDLGGYSDGGRLLKGPGDGVSDSIPAVIGNRQPARLADGEFVVPARIVSELGNGSTEAGARKLYAMMDRVQKARRKTVGKNKVAANTKADKFLPA